MENYLFACQVRRERDRICEIEFVEDVQCQEWEQAKSGVMRQKERNKKQEMRAVTGRGVITIVRILRQNKGKKLGYVEGVELFFLGLFLHVLRGVLGAGQKIIRRGGREDRDELEGMVLTCESVVGGGEMRKDEDVVELVQLEVKLVQLGVEEDTYEMSKVEFCGGVVSGVW